MALNLNNPITENLSASLLAGPDDDCQGQRTGYEVIVMDEKYALLPLSSHTNAKIGEEVQIDSMGLMKRGIVVRILSGTQAEFIEQTVVEETDSTYRVHERIYKNSQVRKRDLTVNKYPV